MTTLALLGLLGALAAQDASLPSSGLNAVAAPPEEAPWVVTPPVTVTAPAPRLWKLVRGGSTVWVLGEVSPLPRGLAWNTAPLAHVIKGAGRVLLPPEGAAGLLDALGALVRSRLPGGATLDAALPSDVDRRYRAVLARLGRDPDKPRRDKPAWAALFLEFDFITSRQVDASEPFRTISRIAREHHVPVRRVATYKRTDILNQLVSLPESEGEAALSDAAAGVNFGIDHAGAAGRAWAAGDLKTVRVNISLGETPLVVFLHTNAGRQTYARAVDDTTDALRSALEKPGVTVAVVRLADLVQRDGALDRLRVQGVEVTEPPL